MHSKQNVHNAATWPKINEMSFKQPGEIALCPPIVSHKKLNKKNIKASRQHNYKRVWRFIVIQGELFLAALEPKVIFSH